LITIGLSGGSIFTVGVQAVTVINVASPMAIVGNIGNIFTDVSLYVLMTFKVY
jgi:hypothetical protein